MNYAKIRNKVAIGVENKIDDLFRSKLKNINQYGVLNYAYHADQIEKSALIDGILILLGSKYNDDTKKEIDNFIENESLLYYRGKSFGEIGTNQVNEIYDDFCNFYE